MRLTDSTPFSDVYLWRIKACNAKGAVAVKRWKRSRGDQRACCLQNNHLAVTVNILINLITQSDRDRQHNSEHWTRCFRLIAFFGIDVGNEFN